MSAAANPVYPGLLRRSGFGCEGRVHPCWMLLFIPRRVDDRLGCPAEIGAIGLAEGPGMG